jgi:hypothetical protein
MTRPRFSLRALLLLTLAVAAFCYWRDRPRQMAKRFVAVMEAGDYITAEAMMGRKGGARAINTKWHVTLGEQSIVDWLRGRYPITAEATFGLNFYGSSPLEATATGIMYRGAWESTDQGARQRWKLLAPLG